MKPTTDTTDLALLESILAKDGAWCHAREIAESPEWLRAYPGMFLSKSERMIRAIASGSNGAVVSYPGSAGYKLRRLATDEEIQTAVAKLRHQAREMLERATQTECFGQEQAQPSLF